MIRLLILLGPTAIAPRFVAGTAITSEVDFPACARSTTVELRHTDEVGA